MLHGDHVACGAGQPYRRIVGGVQSRLQTLDFLAYLSSAVASLDQATQQNAQMAQDAARRTGEMTGTARGLQDRVDAFVGASDAGGARSARAA